MKENTLVIFPTESEAQPFIGKYGQTCHVEICGIGLVECAAKCSLLIAKHNPSFVVLAGVAGAYNNSGLQKGECVAITRENNADMGSLRGEIFVPLNQSETPPIQSDWGYAAAENYYVCNFDYPEHFKRVVSNSVNCTATNEKNIKFGTSLVENMEGAAFFNICIVHGIKFAELRAISNFVGEEKSSWIIPKASENLSECLYTFLKDVGAICV